MGNCENAKKMENATWQAVRKARKAKSAANRALKAAKKADEKLDLQNFKYWEPLDD
ncbi:hypothetical protein OROMI_028694 [Orobanche minor]